MVKVTRTGDLIVVEIPVAEFKEALGQWGDHPGSGYDEAEGAVGELVLGALIPYFTETTPAPKSKKKKK